MVQRVAKRVGPWARACLLVAALSGLVAAAPRQDGVGGLADVLARLEAASAEERRLAEAELGARVGPADGPELARFAQAASAEARARVAAALAQHDRHLELVDALLAAGGAAAELGDAALDGLVARFEPGLFDAPLVDVALWQRLEELGSRGAAPLGRLDLAQPPYDVARDLSRWDGLPLRLVVDPVLVHTPAPPTGSVGEFVGDWRDMLRELVLRLDLAFEAHLVAPDGPRDEAPILVLRVTRRGLEGRVRGRDLVERWLEQYRAPERPADRAAAASALATLGWPAGQQHLLARWRSRGERDALVGLLNAAEFGTAPPSLPSRADAARILDLVRADVFDGGPRRGLFARDALEGLVGLPRLDASGGALFADADGTPLVLVPEPSQARRSSGDAAFARFALELTGRARITAPGLEERLRAWIAGPPAEVRPAERLLALAAWARCSTAPAPAPVAPAALLREARDRAAAEELWTVLAASGAPLPEDWLDPAAWNALDGASGVWPRAVAVAWCVARGDVERAAVGVRSSFPDDDSRAVGRDELAVVLAAAVGRGAGAIVRAVLEAAAIDAHAAAHADELAALSGARDTTRDAAFADGLHARAVGRRDGGGHGDPVLLGALVASPAGERARALLLGEFVGAAEAPAEARARRDAVLAGLERAAHTWFAARRDGEAAAFVAALKRMARERARDPLAERVLALEWPRGAGPAPQPLRRGAALQ
jgi:hypothetical protein